MSGLLAAHYTLLLGQLEAEIDALTWILERMDPAEEEFAVLTHKLALKRSKLAASERSFAFLHQ